MKKLFIVLIALLALGALALPGLIGAWLPGQIEESLEQNWPDATTVIERGWFSTTAVAQQGDSRLNLEFQHLRWWRGAVLDASGELRLTEPEAQIELNGQFSLTGNLQIKANSDRIHWAGVGTNQIDQVDIALDLQRNGTSSLKARADQLNLADPYANELKLQTIQIDSQWQDNNKDLRQIKLEIQVQRGNQPNSMLEVTASSIEPEALNQLSTALGELNGAPPESLQAQMAGLGLLSAWQQLVQAGLKLDLHQLQLDQQVTIEGSWQPNQPLLMLQGKGHTPTALDWLTPLFGLNQGIPPEQARQQIWQWMQDISNNHNALTLNGEHFELDTSQTDTP